MQWPLGASTRIEGNLGVTSDRQKLVRSFIDPATINGDQVDADGQRILPVETTMYVDARAVHTTHLAGPHEIVGGAALTWGKLRATIEEFDMTFTYTPVPIVPDISERPINEGGDVETERHFFGAYLHDSWTPHPRFTVGAGGRVDLTGEDLESEDPATGGTVKDSKEDTGWSGDGTLLVRMLSTDPERGNVLNAYASARRNFKPSAPNVTEPEGARILEPETSVGYEGGLKARGWEGQVSLDGSVFQLDLENQVITVQDVNGNPALANAGKTQYRGEEVSLTVTPRRVPGLKVEGGYAHHDPKFISFTRPNGAPVDGKRPELAPQELWNVGASWTGGPRRFTVWAASHGAGESFFNRRNTFIVPSWSEWDAGVSVETGPARWSVSGRNLSDERHVVAESEIGDSQFYVAAPRRIAAAVTVKI
jgi:outer membrane receptor protein involved in Fe transport